MSDKDLEIIAAVAEGTAAGSTRSLQKIVLNLLDGPTQHIGLQATAWLERQWPVDRAVVVGERVVSRLEASGAARRSIAPKVLFPAFQEAALEDNDELINWWVELLATAATAEAPEVSRTYVEILREITPLDAQVLQWVRDREPDIDPNEGKAMGGAASEAPAPRRPRATNLAVVAAFGITEYQFDLMASRLERQGLCDVGRWVVPTRLGTSATGSRRYDSIALRPLGVSFVDACRPTKAPTD